MKPWLSHLSSWNAIEITWYNNRQAVLETELQKLKLFVEDLKTSKGMLWNIIIQHLVILELEDSISNNGFTVFA